MVGRILHNARIGTKFNLLLVLIFAMGISLSGVALSNMLQQRAQHEVTSQATLLIEMVNSIRQYTLENVNPLLIDDVDKESVFIPEAIPAFSARESVEVLRKQEQYQNFFFKDAMRNPTNLRDKADNFETKLIDRFSSDPETKELSGFRDLPGGKIFYISRPIVVRDAKCLRCHTSPELAPKSQVATYGAENGFGWKLHEVVGAHVVSVPASAVFDNSKKSFAFSMSILMGIFTAVILVINFLLKRAIITPIRQIAKAAEAVSTGKLEIECEQTSNDEIGALARAFNRMKASLTISMKLLNQRNP